MLNSCVSRSVMLRTGSSRCRPMTVVAPSLTAGHRQRRQQQAVAAVQRRVHFARSARHGRAARARSPPPGCSGPSRAEAARSACSRPAGSRASSRDRPRLRPARCAGRSVAMHPQRAEWRHRRGSRRRVVSRSHASSNRAATCGSSSGEEVRARNAEPQSLQRSRRDRRRVRHAGEHLVTGWPRPRPIGTAVRRDRACCSAARRHRSGSRRRPASVRRGRTPPTECESSRRCRCRSRRSTCRPGPMRPTRQTIRPAIGWDRADGARGRTPSLRSSCRARTRAGWSCRRTPRRPRGAAPRRPRHARRRDRAGRARPALVGVPRRSIRSLSEIGTPCSGPR